MILHGQTEHLLDPLPFECLKAFVFSQVRAGTNEGVGCEILLMRGVPVTCKVAEVK